MEISQPLKPKDYKSDVPPIWCAGCGDYGVLASLTMAFSQNNVKPSDTVLVSGIGCSSRLPYFVTTFGMHTCHGRALPIATGIKLAKPDLRVVVVGGDGDHFSIGGGHLPHAARKNIDLLLIVMDNSIYGLTKGQVSPTSRPGMATTTTPYGSPDVPVNPVAYALVYGASFVAQSFSSNTKLTTDLIGKALNHKGFAFINVISPCPTFNKVDTFEYYKPLLKNIDEIHPDKGDKVKALSLAITMGRNNGEVPIGLFYQEERPTYVEMIQEIKIRNKGTDHPELGRIMDILRP
ncbi:MAG: 2-oxoacid:ferredoxin oxidoreductase subunit beta [Nitrospirae bacterium]|nr:2-oxoacid:ferredoxin oxidoreductase subunit beta [Nitrospirota bacterium]